MTTHVLLGGMTMTRADREEIWSVWNSLSVQEPSPVKRISLRTGFTTDEVASVVYPPSIFGEWKDEQEPDL